MNENMDVALIPSHTEKNIEHVHELVLFDRSMTDARMIVEQLDIRPEKVRGILQNDRFSTLITYRSTRELFFVNFSLVSKLPSSNRELS